MPSATIDSCRDAITQFEQANCAWRRAAFDRDAARVACELLNQHAAADVYRDAYLASLPEREPQ